jgi:anthraniloyl-CoA monooxygenase
VLRDGERVDVDGHALCAISRHRMLAVLREAMEAEGIPVTYDTPLRAGDVEADLIVAADGTESAFRSVGVLTREPPTGARFAWFGTTAAFPQLTFVFRRTEWGVFVAHAYSYAEDESAFIVEATDVAWQRALAAGSTTAVCEAVFADDLGGARLLGDASTLRTFEQIRLSRWFADGVVLVGDAAHTAHFSIGSGTSLAFADAVALAVALAEQPSVAGAAAAYEAVRRPLVEIAQDLSRRSSLWFATIDDRWATLDGQGLAAALTSRTGQLEWARNARNASRSGGIART